MTEEVLIQFMSWMATGVVGLVLVNAAVTMRVVYELRGNRRELVALKRIVVKILMGK